MIFLAGLLSQSTVLNSFLHWGWWNFPLPQFVEVQISWIHQSKTSCWPSFFYIKTQHQPILEWPWKLSKYCRTQTHTHNLYGTNPILIRTQMITTNPLTLTRISKVNPILTSSLKSSLYPQSGLWYCEDQPKFPHFLKMSSLSSQNMNFGAQCAASTRVHTLTHTQNERVRLPLKETRLMWFLTCLRGSWLSRVVYGIAF